MAFFCTHFYTETRYIHTKMSITLARIAQYTSMSTQNEAYNVLFQVMVFVCTYNRHQKAKTSFFVMSSIISADLSKVCLHLLWRETTLQPANSSANSFHMESSKNQSLRCTFSFSAGTPTKFQKILPRRQAKVNKGILCKN